MHFSLFASRLLSATEHTKKLYLNDLEALLDLPRQKLLLLIQAFELTVLIRVSLTW